MGGDLVLRGDFVLRGADGDFAGVLSDAGHDDTDADRGGDGVFEFFVEYHARVVHAGGGIGVIDIDFVLGAVGDFVDDLAEADGAVGSAGAGGERGEVVVGVSGDGGGGVVDSGYSFAVGWGGGFAGTCFDGVGEVANGGVRGGGGLFLTGVVFGNAGAGGCAGAGEIREEASEEPDGGPIEGGEYDGGEGHSDEDFEAENADGEGELFEFFDASAFVDEADGEDEGDDEPEPILIHAGIEGGEGVEERGEGEECHWVDTPAEGVDSGIGADAGAATGGVFLSFSRSEPVIRRRTSNMTRRLSMPAMPQ